MSSELFSVNEIMKLFAVTARTLHYYDQIGLLHPAKITDNGYRWYSRDEIERLQQIVFLKELGFKLKEIKDILDNPLFSREELLKKQKQVLLEKQKQIKNMMKLIDRSLEGENVIIYHGDPEALLLQKEYYNEILAKYKNSKYIQEFEKNCNNRGSYEKWQHITQKADDIFSKIADKMNQSYGSDDVQKLVDEWKQYISKELYSCSKEMLKSLSEMYIADKRFIDYFENIAAGLSEYVYKAIDYYCS